MTITLFHKEAIFVALVLLIPLPFAAHIRATELIATAAVFFTFLHGQMGTRMQEAEAAKDKPAVKGHWKIILYQILKEALWVVFFAMTQAWAALVGAVVFFLYPLWRQWHRKLHPLKI